MRQGIKTQTTMLLHYHDVAGHRTREPLFNIFQVLRKPDMLTKRGMIVTASGMPLISWTPQYLDNLSRTRRPGRRTSCASRGISWEPASAADFGAYLDCLACRRRR